MTKRTYQPWPGIAFDAWRLGMDSAAVIAMRMAKLSAGGAGAAIEAQRMCGEKIHAAIGLQMLAMGGALGTNPAQAAARSLRHYGPKVRANKRRLRKKKAGRALSAKGRKRG